jgi:hypothetical protein
MHGVVMLPRRPFVLARCEPKSRTTTVIFARGTVTLGGGVTGEFERTELRVSGEIPSNDVHK